MAEHMVTTVDNPFNPFTEFDEWNAFDTRAGYYTLAFLSRVMVNSNELSEVQQDEAYEEAVDEIVRENILGIYRKVPNPNPAPTPVDDSADVTV